MEEGRKRAQPVKSSDEFPKMTETQASAPLDKKNDPPLGESF